MKRSLDLMSKSPDAWLEAVMGDFDSFLQDHADCERKASAMALSLVAKFPDRVAIIPRLIETAVEELDHFQRVYAIMEKRGIRLTHELKEDPYIKGLMTLMSNGIESRFMDRLLLGSILECRGAEKFKLIWNALPQGELKKFYHELWTTEAKHGNVYVEMALEYFEESKVYKRLAELNNAEGLIVASLPPRAALH